MREFTVIIALCGLARLAFGASVSAAAKARPFQGYVVGQVWFTPDEASPSIHDLWTDSAACGNVSHLGATAMTGRYPTPASDAIADGRMTFVAANGDELWMEYGGTAPFPVVGVPSTIVAVTDFQIARGTGRFVDASGGGQMTGYVEFPGQLTPGLWPARWEWRTTISY